MTPAIAQTTYAIGRMTLLILVALPLGCTTSRQLLRSTSRQVRTVADIHQQQIMDNLAMFVYDPNSFPFFAVPDGGSADVTDNASGSIALNWIASGFDSAALD